jgi:hypothetical protein
LREHSNNQRRGSQTTLQAYILPHSLLPASGFVQTGPSEREESYPTV